MTMLTIDRTEQFNVIQIFGERPQNAGFGDGHPTTWSIVREVGSTALTELDASKLHHGKFVSEADPGRWTTTHAEYVRRMEISGCTPLDAQVLSIFLENQDLIPEDWKALRFVRFDGTLFKSLNGGERVLCLYWSGASGWDCVADECRNWKRYSGFLYQRPQT